jgi:hypothetical protein
VGRPCRIRRTTEADAKLTQGAFTPGRAAAGPGPHRRPLACRGWERQRSRPDLVHERVRQVPDEHRSIMVVRAHGGGPGLIPGCQSPCGRLCRSARFIDPMSRANLACACRPSAPWRRPHGARRHGRRRTRPDRRQQ